MVLVNLIATQARAADYIVCESDQDRRRYCNIRDAENADVELSRQLSNSMCTEGYSWGRDRRGVWVDNGCRAEFSIYRRYHDSYDDRERDRDREREADRERERLQREEERIRQERQEIERERERIREQESRAREERCPPGFVPGGYRCSENDRRRGCKDMRMPGGTTCNSRGWNR